jgi:hypothetical protein
VTWGERVAGLPNTYDEPIVDMGVFTWLLQPQPVVFTRG